MFIVSMPRLWSPYLQRYDSRVLRSENDYSLLHNTKACNERVGTLSSGRCFREIGLKLIEKNRTSERSERVRFLMQKQRVHKYRTKHFPCGIVFIIHILRHSSFWRPFYFKSFKTAKICRYTLTAKWQRIRSISFLVKTLVKNMNEGEDVR